MFDQRTADAEAECDRLRNLLRIARDGLHAAIAEINDLHESADAAPDTSYYWEALRRSDPDATAQTEQ